MFLTYCLAKLFNQKYYNQELINLINANLRDDLGNAFDVLRSVTRSSCNK